MNWRRYRLQFMRGKSSALAQAYSGGIFGYEAESEMGCETSVRCRNE